MAQKSIYGVWGMFSKAVGSVIPCRCIFGELLKRKAMLPGRNEIEQLELVYRLMGSPTGAAQDRLKCCEGWEKMRDE